MSNQGLSRERLAHLDLSSNPYQLKDSIHVLGGYAQSSQLQGSYWTTVERGLFVEKERLLAKRPTFETILTALCWDSHGALFEVGVRRVPERIGLLESHCITPGAQSAGNLSVDRYRGAVRALKRELSSTPIDSNDRIWGA